MKVLFHAVDRSYLKQGELAASFQDDLRAGKHPRFESAESAKAADAILFIEPNYDKDAEYARRLLADKMIASYPEKCFSIDFTDRPTLFLPGVYVGITASQLDRQRFRSGCYLSPYNDLTAAAATRRDTMPATLLFSFRGFQSSEIRYRIFRSDLATQTRASVVRTDHWFTHGPAEKAAYLEEMLCSKFILCPRGHAPVTIRLFEAMELGRVPVILSDDWAAPEGPVWSECSLHVAESRFEELPAILERFEPSAPTMGAAARRDWERCFSPETRLQGTLESIKNILLLRPNSLREADRQREWLSARFAWKQGWTLPQRIARCAHRSPLCRLTRAAADGTFAAKMAANFKRHAKVFPNFAFLL